MISLLALMMAGALLQDPASTLRDTNAADQTCGPTAHRHAMDLNEHGKFVVNHQKGEYDIVFDGECHDNDKEFVCTPTVTKLGVSTCTETGRKVLKP